MPSGYSLVPDRHDLDLSRLYPLQKLIKIELGICFKWFGRNNRVTLDFDFDVWEFEPDLTLSDTLII